MQQDQFESKKNMSFIIGASSVGTLIEWYDFYIFGMLATIISKQFFPPDSGSSALLSTLAIFAAGFLVRPFGALVFGRLGDIIGRKYTFLLTLILMGGSTFAIGLVPGFTSIGWAAPLIVLALRLIQGLALGGEYGGAATYVAEHAHANRRGFWTSWIQTTATLGLFISLGIIILVRDFQGVDKFSAEWGGWRYPFWISALLVIISIIIRMRMNESPLFAKLKAEKKTSVNPIKESFGHKANFKMVLLALFGATMGQGVVWYTGQFYAQSFIENVCKVNFIDSRNVLLVAILFATPFFVVFASLSDKIGRKWIMLTGMLLGIISYRPIFQTFRDLTNPANRTELLDVSKTKVTTSAATDAKAKNKLLVTTTYDSLYTDGAKYTYKKVDTVALEADYSGTTASVGIVVAGKDSSQKADTLVSKVKAIADASLADGVTFVQGVLKSGKTAVAEKELDRGTFWKIVGLIFILIIFVTLVYGPIAAFLVELFPTKIRYTSMSLPYHVGNGIFGGLVPFLGTLIVEMTKSSSNPNGDPLAGLWYPIGVAAVCFVIGAIYLKDHVAEDVLN